MNWMPLTTEGAGWGKVPPDPMQAVEVKRDGPADAVASS